MAKVKAPVKKAAPKTKSRTTPKKSASTPTKTRRPTPLRTSGNASRPSPSTGSRTSGNASRPSVSTDGKYSVSAEARESSSANENRANDLSNSFLAAHGFNDEASSGIAGGQLEVRSAAAPAPANEAKPTPRPEGAPVEDFNYDGKPPGDYRGAINGNGADPKAGTKANAKINQEYDALSKAYADYLGTDVASFPSMAKHGSVLAGTEIRNLENVQAGLAGDPKALADAARGLGGNTDSIVQGALMGKGLVERAASDEKPADALLNPAGTAGKVAGETVTDGLRTVNAMRDGLVAGNTEIHHSAAPAAHAFLEGEANGGKGMEALREAGYTPGSEHDPHGLYTKAYGMLKDVRRLGLEAASEKDPTKRAELEKQRDAMMKKSNMHLFTQEQLTLEKPHIYGNKDMKDAVKSVGGTMKLKDPNGTYDLLPGGGDWSDYKTRMGYKEVSKPGENSVSINGPNGKKIHYEADPNAVGTVSHYSNTHSTGPNAKKLATSEVGTTDLPPPSTSTGKGVDGIGNGFATGNHGEVAGSAATLPARAIADGGVIGGEALQDHGNSSQRDGYQRIIRNMRNTPGLGDDLQRIAGTGQVIAGEAEKVVGEGVESVSRVAKPVIEAVDKGIEIGVNKGVKHVKKVRDSYRGGRIVPPWHKDAVWWF